jgi:hypothetical protein
MKQNQLSLYLLALLGAIIAIYAIPTPVTKEVATIDFNHELAERVEIPQWFGRTARVYAYNANVWFKMGMCIAGVCYQAGDVKETKSVGIATAIIYGIAAVGKSLLPADYKPGERRRGGNDNYDRFLNIVKDGEATDDLPLLLDFHNHARDQVTFHTKWTNVEMTRLQVMHPVKRSMENVIRVRIPPDHLETTRGLLWYGGFLSRRK